MGAPARVLLVDDHPVTRSGMRALMTGWPEFVVVGEAADGQQALRELERLAPDLVMLDLELPVLGGLDVIRWIGKQAMPVRIAVCSGHSADEVIAEVLRLGAHGFLHKGDLASTWRAGLAAIAAGARNVVPSLSPERIRALLEPSIEPFLTLSPREREVLRLFAEGWTTREIGCSLSISMRTVETYGRNIRRKLGLSTHREMIRFGLRRRMMPEQVLARLT